MERSDLTTTFLPKPDIARRKFKTHLAKIERRNAKRKTPEGLEANAKAVNKYYNKMKELYGGNVSFNLIARAKWILAKHEKETQRSQS